MLSPTIDVHLGDCLDIMPLYPAHWFDAIITDLPYGTTKCSWDEIIPFEPMWANVLRVLKKNGPFITTASQPFTSKLIMSRPELFREEIIWEKERPSNIFNMRKKHGKVHENVLVFCEKSPVFNPQMGIKPGRAVTRAKMQKWVGNQLKHHGEKGKAKTSYREDWDGSQILPRSVVAFNRDLATENHPTQKPVSLYEYLILTYTNPGDRILDISAGSGTTGVASFLTGRNCVLIEKDKAIFNDMQARLVEIQKTPPLFEGI